MTAVARKHADWCAQGTTCGLGEHRSRPHMVDVPGAGRAVLTRVRAESGREWAEIRVTVPLSGFEPRARWQLARLLSGLGRLVVSIRAPRRR